MDTRAVIRTIRDGQEPCPEALREVARALATDQVSDAQVGGLAMAIYLQGLGEEGRVALTLGMRDSGDILQWPAGAPVLDKHSTGGLGDAVSIVLAPALAVCGVRVPMVSGRGLGHSAGTLDKLEAIPGLSTQVTAERLQEIVAEIGFAIVGASGRIAPADKRLYAIRDVVEAVESRDLITSSILSKKLAAGLEGLVMDVKVGTGAFMRDIESARALAQSLVSTAKGAGCKTTALLTDMNEPLCAAMGNATELALCMEVLEGNIEAAPRLYALVLALGAELLGESAPLEAAIASGAALEAFGKMVAALGGPDDFAQNWRVHLPKAPVLRDVLAEAAGYITHFEGVALGYGVVDLGGGRRVESDAIDPSVGFSRIAPLGHRLEKGDCYIRIHAASEAAAEAAERLIRSAIHIGEVPPQVGPLVIEKVL